MIEVRKPKVEEFDMLVKLFDAYRIFYGKNSELMEAGRFLKDRMDHGDSIIFVAVKDGRLLGFVQNYFQWSSVGLNRFMLLNDLFIHPDFRSQGIGKLLIDKVKHYCRLEQCSGILIETTVDNDTANYLYLKEGFEEVSHNFYFWTKRD